LEAHPSAPDSPALSLPSLHSPVRYLLFREAPEENHTVLPQTDRLPLSPCSGPARGYPAAALVCKYWIISFKNV
jgi:hypothetical protein